MFSWLHLKTVKYFPAEAVVWAAGLMGLGFTSTHSDSHFSICPLYHFGFDFCPGCGLGRSISLLLHGHVAESLEVHPLGVFALIVLTLRIFQLLKNYRNLYGANH